MKKTKIKKTILGVVIGFALMLLTFIVLIVGFFYFVMIGGPAKVSKDIKNYPKIFSEDNLETGYMVFPEAIPEGTLKTDYYHSYRLGFFDPTVETYLQCTYDSQTYHREIDRLENSSKTYGNQTKRLLRDDKKKFNYPAYIAIENAGNAYEYALLTGENQITYVYTAYIEASGVHFSDSYLPSDFMTDEGRGFGSGYSIYYAVVTDTMIDTDYTREPVYEVKNGHTRIVNDTYFCVRTKLSENGEEIITDCSQLKSNDITADEEETIYNELNGFIYESIELNKDRTQFIVTYRDGDNRQTATYEVETSE